eukprot:SAG31_NODE_32038_length_361_cov_0.553435_1_plen_92_part_10
MHMSYLKFSICCLLFAAVTSQATSGLAAMPQTEAEFEKLRNDMVEVAVIGAGISGAFCGVRLRAQGIQPVVFDAGRRGPGGRLSSPGGASFF